MGIEAFLVGEAVSRAVEKLDFSSTITYKFALW